MITSTGVQMHPGCGLAPTPRDVAVGMCRITRYAGALWCPLAAHSILVAEYAFLETEDDFLWACGLLHDAHETVTGEVTRHYKPKAMKEYEHELDELIFKSFKLDYQVYLSYYNLIKRMDEKALTAEALELGLKNWPEYYRRMEGHDIIQLSDQDRRIGTKILQGSWRSSAMVMTDSPQQYRLSQILETVQAHELSRARKYTSMLLDSSGWLDISGP